MRLVERDADLPEAIRTARAEAERAFGSGELNLEKAVIDAAPRRDPGLRRCARQRHPSRRARLLGAAPPSESDRGSALARRERRPAQPHGGRRRRCRGAIGYRNAGTVEFLLAADGGFYFLEMNTRLQVEHPVTETVTGLDLVPAAQGRGRREAAAPPGTGEVSGHAIEVRLYAEEPIRLPAADRTHRCLAAGRRAGYPRRSRHERRARDLALLRSVIAKVIAHGADREEARTRLVQALRDTVVLGPTTNRHFLIRLLEHPSSPPARRRRPSSAGISRAMSLSRRSSATVTGRWRRRSCGAGQPSAIRPPCAAGATPIPNRHRSGWRSVASNERSP